MRWYLFLSASVLFIFHQLAQKMWGLHLPVADAYLDPLLCMPILLTGFSLEQKWLTGRPRLELAEVLTATTLMAILFEWGFPKWSAGFTADIWDVPVYFLGAALYYLFGR